MEAKILETISSEDTNKNKLIDAVNENARKVSGRSDYSYITDRQSAIDSMVTTSDAIADFMAAQEHYETRETSHGTIEVFLIEWSRELLVMDFGEYRLVMED